MIPITISPEKEWLFVGMIALVAILFLLRAFFEQK